MRSAMRVLSVGLLSLCVASSFVYAEGKGESKGGKAGGWSVRLGSVSPTAGFEEQSFGGTLVFVSANVSVGSADIASAAQTTNAINLTLTAQGATSVSSLIRSNAGQRIAVYDGARIVAFPVIEASMLKGTSLTASTSPIAPAGPTLNVKAVQATAAAGTMVSFDVYLSGASDLRGYQVAVDVTGGDNGKLTLADIHQDVNRADWVFAGQQIVNASDLNGSRVVAALWNGGVDAGSMKYIGTFSYQASDDASGTFTAKVRVSEDTALRDSNSAPIGYQAGAVGSVQIGATRTK